MMKGLAHRYAQILANLEILAKRMATQEICVYPARVASADCITACAVRMDSILTLMPNPALAVWILAPLVTHVSPKALGTCV